MTAIAAALAGVTAWSGAVPVTTHATVLTRGVAVDVLFDEPVERMLADVDAAAGLGADAVRVSVQWSGLQPVAGGPYATWYVELLDVVVARAQARGMRVLLTPVFTPCWASAGAQGLLSFLCAATPPPTLLSRTPPGDASTFARMAAFLAGRYRAGLAGIEVWNEPNLRSFWTSASPAADYVALLRAAYPAVKRVAPDVPVVAGAVSGSDVPYLRAMYVAAGARRLWDVLSVHPYNDGRPPEALLDVRSTQATWLQGLRAVGALMRIHHDARPLWVTEFGWNTSTRRGRPFLDGVSPDQQAAYLSRALAMLGTPASGIAFPEAAFVFALRDVGTDPAEPLHGYGLLRADGTPKPAYAAVRAAFAARAVKRR